MDVKGFYLFTTLVAFLAALVSSKGARDKPRDVTAQTVNATTLVVRWNPPRAVQDGCSVSRYLIRFKSEHDVRSKTKKVNGSKRSVTLVDLQENTLYLVRLVAVSCRGKSQPTRWAKARTLSRPMGDGRIIRQETAFPGKPVNVRTRTLTDSIILMWEPPDDSILVRGYMVGYGVGVPDVNWQYVDANTREFTIRNLRASTQYVISLRAFNNYGKGPVVYDLIYTREQQGGTSPKPMSAPIGLKSKVLSPSTVWLEWIDPSLGRAQKITDDRYYIVNYKPVPYGDVQSVTVKALNVVLYDLEPATQYEFRVKALKGTQTTQWGISVYNKTYEAPPGSPPRNLTVFPGNSSTSVRVTWAPPDRPYGSITGYLLLYTNDPNLPEREWTAESMNAGFYTAKVHGLIPKLKYFFKIQARNSKGYSPLSPTVTFNPLPDPDDLGLPGPLVPEKTPKNVSLQPINASSVMITWSPPDETDTEITGYLLLYSTNPLLPDGEWTAETLEGSRRSTIVYGLQPNNKYFFKLLARNMFGRGPFSTTLIHSVGLEKDDAGLRTPTGLMVSPGDKPASVKVTWFPPERPDGDVTGYFLYHATDPGVGDHEWTSEAVLGDALATMVKDLYPGTQYYFKVQALTSRGYGPMSRAVTYRTPPFQNIPGLDEMEVDEPRSETMTTLSAELATQDLPEVLPSRQRDGPETLGLVAPQPPSDNKPRVKIHAVVEHTVSAVITWRETGPSCDGHVDKGHFRVQYYSEKDPQSTHMVNTTVPLAVLSNLMVNTRYKCDVSRFLPGDPQPHWLASQTVDTHV